MDEVRALCNMKIFVDTDDDVRLARRIKRDTIDRGRDVNGACFALLCFAFALAPAFLCRLFRRAFRALFLCARALCAVSEWALGARMRKGGSALCETSASAAARGCCLSL